MTPIRLGETEEHQERADENLRIVVGQDDGRQQSEVQDDERAVERAREPRSIE